MVRLPTMREAVPLLVLALLQAGALYSHKRASKIVGKFP